MDSNVVEILLVEDNRDDEELAISTLKEFRVGNKIHVVRDGAQALDFIFCQGDYADRKINERPRVVLLDLKLPKVDGVEVLRQIRKDPRTASLCVVVLTSSHEERDLVNSYSLGVNSYIVKPVDFDQFTNVIREVGHYWLILNAPPVV